jgi:hypothetical protein
MASEQIDSQQFLIWQSFNVSTSLFYLINRIKHNWPLQLVNVISWRYQKYVYEETSPYFQRACVRNFVESKNFIVRL